MVNKENVLKVANAFATQSLAKECGIGYDQGTYWGHTRHGFDDYSGNECGTVACIAGWTVAVCQPRRTALGHHYNIETRARELLGLQPEQAMQLFSGGANPNRYNKELATCTVAAVLKNLAETGKVDWDKAWRETRDQANG